MNFLLRKYFIKEEYTDNYLNNIEESEPGIIIKYQDEYESFIFVPDLHAITVPQDAKLLHERIKKNVALYIACGVLPEKNTIYIQSDNLYHTNLSWILECNTEIENFNKVIKNVTYIENLF